MIRYVLAVVLTSALFGVAVVGVDRAATIRGESQVEQGIAAVESVALSLVEHEELPPPGQEGARRVVEFDLPADGLTTHSVESLVFERRPGTNLTTVAYRIDGGAVQTTVIHAPIENANPDTEILDFGGSTDSYTLVLELRTDEDGKAVVETTVE